MTLPVYEAKHRWKSCTPACGICGRKIEIASGDFGKAKIPIQRMLEWSR